MLFQRRICSFRVPKIQIQTQRSLVSSPPLDELQDLRARSARAPTTRASLSDGGAHSQSCAPSVTSSSSSSASSSSFSLVCLLALSHTRTHTDTRFKLAPLVNQSPDHNKMGRHGHSHSHGGGHSSADETTPLKASTSSSFRSSNRRIPLDAAAQRAQRKLQLACVCSLLFMVAEVVGGFLAGSLAIMTDAAHLLSDVAGFCISLFAIWATTLPASSRLSFGFQRAEVIGAITSVLVIWVLTGVLVYAAVERFLECLEPNPKERVNGRLMFIVACIGLLVNLVLMQILGHGHSHGGGGSHGHSHGGSSSSKPHGHGHSHGNGSSHDLEHGHGHSHGGSKKKKEKKHENLNIQAAYIHALGDFIQSVGVCIAGGLIWYNPSWQIADPIATFVFSILVLGTTVGIVRESIHVLMEGTPEGINSEEIESGLRALPAVLTTHDLHIWSLSAGLPSLSVHVVSEDPDAALHEAQGFLLAHGITHTTIQVERPAKTYPRNCAADLKCGQDSPQHHA